MDFDFYTFWSHSLRDGNSSATGLVGLEVEGDFVLEDRLEDRLEDAADEYGLDTLERSRL